MSPEVAEFIDKPMNPETMDDQACLRLTSIIVGSFRNDYIWGKTHLLKYYHDMDYKEWIYTRHDRGGSPWLIKLYFEVKEAILSDQYGISGFIDPKDIIYNWDQEVEKNLRRKA